MRLSNAVFLLLHAIDYSIHPNRYSHLSAALQWGRDNERRARDQYAAQLGSNFSIRESGLHISELGFLGATPDSLLYNSENIIVEIKCPYSACNNNVSAAATNGSFFCTKDENNAIHLCKNHNYYYQVQGQLAIVKVEWCDFVVWTRTDCTVERISFDTNFWNTSCLPILGLFISTSCC